MRTFLLIWFGQLISLIGSGLTSFALGVWLYQTTGSSVQFSLMYVCAELPYIILAPFGGAIADRWNRRWLIILSDSISAVCTLSIALLMWQNWLQIWHLYLAVAVSSGCKGFQQPAYYTTPTLFVSQKHFSRANGMIQLAQGAGQLLSPILAGILVDIIKISGVILIDFISFIIALLILLAIPFPSVSSSQYLQHSQTSLLDNIGEGWNYIKARPGLLTLLMFFFITDFTIGLVQVLITPMVLSFANAKVLGQIFSIGGSGWLFGAVLMSTWGGFKRKVNAVLCFEFILGLSILVAGLQPSAILITVAAFFAFFSVPIIISSHNSIWQVKVDPKVQGRVFALRGAIAWAAFPLAYLLAGPLADYVFQPLLLIDGLLANSIGLLIGVGPGRGIGLLFNLVGIFVMLATIVAYNYPYIRKVEDDLPDFIKPV
ncbi:MFS transporter [Nostoc cf. edaphicum LEGE 07299]|uniref:MFS transporter n=1 Tax=Nostoc cf. edaphicum LEGE 07299 TaxID=2777974 RepID=A0ABR9TUT9_9NOSO|nr:MFS transporter [Nostoc edaphicum]MBE9104133.1 MFS transporter [Nostoc cf. edaphicum LEGE 07299]